jgi:two-component system, OmpR family, alkaline phosphatase synthesis response regulator PhoP
MDIGKKTVLLVDDDEDMLAQLRIAIEREYIVEVAYSGEEALNKLTENHFSCIVMDVMMKTLSDGLDTAKIIKENPATKTIPIIMVTGVNQHFDYRSQIDGDFFPKDKWFSKPVDPNRLLEEINKLVQC